MKNRRSLMILAVLAMVAVPAAVALAKSAPVDVSGTTWGLEMSSKLKISKVGGAQGTSEATLAFGPNVDLGLDAGEFQIDDNEGGTYTGTYTDLKQNGNIILNVDQGELEDFLVNVIDTALEDAGHTITGTTATITKLQAKVKISLAKNTAKGTFKVQFTGSATIDGDFGEGKGSFSAKGSGQQIF
jgi:hypothetical protein